MYRSTLAWIATAYISKSLGLRFNFTLHVAAKTSSPPTNQRNLEPINLHVVEFSKTDSFMHPSSSSSSSFFCGSTAQNILVCSSIITSLSSRTKSELKEGAWSINQTNTQALTGADHVVDQLNRNHRRKRITEQLIGWEEWLHSELRNCPWRPLP